MIVATIIGGNSETLIADAIKSALTVADRFILVDTGITNGTIEAAKAIVPTLEVRKFPWFLSNYYGVLR